ncbi:PQQ-binding-like beta-propeller repeat protein [Paraglaciecola aquimarina]|uniref:PQQ-binding-like beta-propeller repeat protein n=1 Tax=Paraglaciecola aquimarina TaxID=1235557 RepID=A0ABU3SVQ7_9ALTE|nr:PQQ-binding-like beta-propeller repeat protein [Paraglaciecola aquimarina]MDU0354105.1 PQQ-binding-like beta-propeller repeat protein [Paraglaciecola aquimarina]
MAEFLQQRKQQNLGLLDTWELKKNPKWNTLTKHKQSLVDYVLAKDRTLEAPYQNLQQAEQALSKKGQGSDIILYSLNANTGAIEWTKTVKGTKQAMYNYTFSDATSPSPATDGQHIWVVNAAGGMAAFTMQGKPVWSRTFSPTKNAPFNKQYDTILYENMIFNVEPKVEGDNKRVDNWNYLHAFDKNTGKRLWVSEDGLTHYSTPVLSHTKEGIPAIMIGRGGPHDVPEKPQGLSLIDLRPESAGQSLWQWKAPQYSKAFGGIEIQTWDKDTTFWQQGFQSNRFEMYQLDSSTGKFKTKHNLLKTINRFEFDTNLQDYVYQKRPDLEGHWDRQPYTQVVIGNKMYYMIRYQPYIAMQDLTSGENTLLEIPTEIKREKGKVDQLVWKIKQTTDQLNAKGQRHNPEPRAQGDGTQKAFLGTPIVVNNQIFFTNAHGITYVIDANKPFNPEALIAINDLGEAGKTVSLNAMAYSNGKLFHRSLKSIICIE